MQYAMYACNAVASINHEETPFSPLNLMTDVYRLMVEKDTAPLTRYMRHHRQHGPSYRFREPASSMNAIEYMRALGINPYREEEDGMEYRSTYDNEHGYALSVDLQNIPILRTFGTISEIAIANGLQDSAVLSRAESYIKEDQQRMMEFVVLAWFADPTGESAFKFIHQRDMDRPLDMMEQAQLDYTMDAGIMSGVGKFIDAIGIPEDIRKPLAFVIATSVFLDNLGIDAQDIIIMDKDNDIESLFDKVNGLMSRGVQPSDDIAKETVKEFFDRKSS
jgi:hypothetical protein